MKFDIVFVPLLVFLTAACAKSPINDADVIFYNGHILCLDSNQAIVDAIAIRDDRIIAVGKTKEIMKLAGDQTRRIDLHGKSAIPGIIDNHVHPLSASQSEYGKKLPHMESINDLFVWISEQAKSRKPGEWIVHPKFFFTRLKEKRWPTLEELDKLAPENPVFLNGSYAGMINTRAIEISDIIGKNEAAVVRDTQTQQPTGLIRASGLKLFSANLSSHLSKEEQLEALKRLFEHYNQMGITSICAGNGGTIDLDLVKELHKRGELTVRIFQNFTFPFDPKATLPEIREALDVLPYKTGDGDEWVKVGALKLFLDGGVLTGTAFMGAPWGERGMKLYGFPSASFRGEINFTREQLANVMTAAIEKGWKFTSHVTGEAGVDTLIAAYHDVHDKKSIREGRHSIIHGNFFSPEASKLMAEMNLYADVQPAWLFKDAEMLTDVLGADRMTHFHPYRSMLTAGVLLNGGSDHMVKLDPDQAINPYNPFQAMWTMISHQTQGGTTVHPDQTISREQALKMYTINNAYASFEENEKGSLAPGKLADLVVIPDNILTCSEESLKNIRPILTMVGGKIVYDAGSSSDE